MCRYLFILFYVYTTLGYVTINDKNFEIIKWSPPGKGDLPEFAELVTSSQNPNVTGRLVYVVHPPFTSYAYYTEPFIDRIQLQVGKGAIGCITSPRDGRVPGHVIFGALGVRQLQIPIGMVSKEAIDYASKTKYANITFHGWDPNPWYDTRQGTGYILFSVVIGGLYLLNVVLSGYRIASWVYAISGIEFNIWFLCLSLEFFCNLTRILQIIFYGTYNNYSIPGVSVLITLPFCITLITSIIIVFFWLELTSDPFYHGRFLGIMKIPAGIFIVICIVLEIVSDVMRNVTMVDFMNYIVNFYGVALALVAIFNFIAAFRVLQSLNQSPDSKTLKIIVYRIIASGIATIFGVINLFVFLNPTVNWTPYGWLLLWFFLYFTFWLQSFLMILIFQVPKKEKAETAKETVKQKSEESNETDLDSKSTET